MSLSSCQTIGVLLIITTTRSVAGYRSQSKTAWLPGLSSSLKTVPRRAALGAAATALAGVPLGRVAAGASQGPPGVGGVVEPAVEQPLQRLEIPGALGGNYVTLQLAINGQRIPVLIDTGFSADLLLTPKAAKALGATDRGVALSVTSYRKGLQRIVRIPGLRFPSASGAVSVSAPADALVGDIPLAMASKDLAGMIGLSAVWEAFDVDLDLRSSALRLYRQGDSRQVALQKGMIPVKASPIAKFGIPALNLLAPDGGRILGLVDTGSTFTIANPAAAEILGLKPEVRFGEFAGVGFAEVGTKEAVFEPGKLGLQLDSSTGVVTEIVPNGQAERLGVREGWRLDELEDEGFTPARLQDLLQGKSNFTISFKEGTLESMTRLAQGVPLRVDRGGWRPLELAYVFKPDRIAIGDLTDLEEFVGPGNPGMILGLDVLKNRRLIFADGDRMRRTLFLG